MDATLEEMEMARLEWQLEQYYEQEDRMAEMEDLE